MACSIQELNWITHKKDNPKLTVCIPEQKTPNESVVEDIEPAIDPEQDKKTI